MKCFLESRLYRLRYCLLAAVVIAVTGSIAAVGELPFWIRNIEAKSVIEAAFFRMMSLPNAAIAFRRPPAETRIALTESLKSQPRSGELDALRALADEQSLDFTAAESDWKAFVENSPDKVEAQLALSDFYRRRLRPSDEIGILSLVTAAPATAAENLSPPSQQRSWQAYERIFEIIRAQSLPADLSSAQYRSWIKRYPANQSLYARFMEFLITQKDYSAATVLIGDYRKQFPDDQIFPVEATALMAYRRGAVREGLSVYQHSFQPLWDPQLVKSYFDLLRDTQNLRRFRDDARAALAADPGDLNATARLFYYYQQQGSFEGAERAISDLRMHRDSKKSPWTSQELYVCARLLEEIHSYPEAARYYFALYNSKELPNAQETSVAALTGILLTAPETPIRFGSGDLSMYRDIATMDQGPGYLNGILSLILNTTQPSSQYAEEEQRAGPYFRRARAAQLLTLLDEKFPNSPRRPELHAQLLEFYANSGESAAVIGGGAKFLVSFPAAPERTSVSLLMADAYARQGNTKEEFAIYDAVLQELAHQAQNVPLGSFGDAYATTRETFARISFQTASEDRESQATEPQPPVPASSLNSSSAFRLTTPATESQTGPRSAEYSRVLERYLGRLSETKQIPSALVVLRREIDRNPNDPGLYERFAAFLEQNRLGSQQEEVYRLAISKFSDKTWYDRLARAYLRHKKVAEFERLTQDAISAFKGTELERYFNGVVSGTPDLYLRLNLYANQRFPHSPVFVRNLLSAYEAPATHDAVAWEALLRQHWFEEADLRNRFFQFLSSSGKLNSELREVESQANADGAKNPAAETFVAYANLWRSHFEQGAPALQSLAQQYPAEPEISHTASSVFRSLAYLDPSNTAVAAKIEDDFLQANPSDTETMARIGDIYADRQQFSQASSYWERIPKVAAGEASGYLEAATIYWDYFDFDNAIRLLAQGRQKLANPSLFAYEAGAIYENQRDYGHAIQEYVKGALASPNSSAESRLLELARRPALRDLVNQNTVQLSAATSPMSAILLRVKILDVQERRPEIEPLLAALTMATTSIEQAQEIETLAQQKSFETVRRYAIEKQAELTTDPVNRLQLRYALIRFDEERKEFASAQKNIEAIYREDPKILGVVRSTVDFYWRMKMPNDAIAILLLAAKEANPILSTQFNYEAARKSTEAKQFQQARDLLSQLLHADPYNGEYLAAMADTYAQAGDDTGLQRFYLDQITAFRNAPLPADSRKAQIATLRRGLVPALTRTKSFSGAIDQYIETINAFPEDEAVATEAARYASRYKQQERLVNFYVKTVAQSPRDYRWSMVLGRTYSQLENYPAAIDAFSKSIAIRPDRVDLYIARAELEERLMRFDDTASDYERIYKLAYKDPQWMEKVAIVRARQGKTNDVVDALKAAVFQGHPEHPSGYFEIARRLEGWGFLEQALAFAEQGVAKAGSDLLADPANLYDVKTYVRVSTRLRHHGQVFTVLETGLKDSSATLPVFQAQLARSGLAGLTDSQWRENVRLRRIENARAGMRSALEEMGSAVNAYFTPEERLSFAQLAESKCNSMPPSDIEEFAIPLAMSASLADQESRWRFNVLLSKAASGNTNLNVQPFVDLERRRGRFPELGAQLEKLVAAHPRELRTYLLVNAADAYRSAGDEQSELRTLSATFSSDSLDSNREERFFGLLLKQQPQELVRIASSWSAAGERAADFVVAHATPAVAHAAVAARSRARPPIWKKANDALVGIYFSELTPEIRHAFLSALGNSNIGERLAKPVERAQQLAGNTWFYYGSRYGEYLKLAKSPESEGFLSAELEASPASASGYLNLAEYYSTVGDTTRAIAEYQHTLDLSPARPDVLDALASKYYKSGDRSAALTQWKRALQSLLAQIERQSPPESFWRDFGKTCDDLRTRHLFSELEPDVDSIVRAYLNRNGAWRSNAVLQPVFAAQKDPATAAAWLLSVSSSAPDSATVLGDVVSTPWVPAPQRALIYQRILELKEAAVTQREGLDRQGAEQDLTSWQQRWIQYFLNAKQYYTAETAIASVPQQMREAQLNIFIPLELQVAARTGKLDPILDGYKAAPDKAPAAEILRDAARKLSDAGDNLSARKILEFVFAREIEAHNLVATNFLGLAEIRLATDDTAGALDLLHRMVTVVGNENLDPASALLERTGHHAQAIEFLTLLTKMQPWQHSYRLRLANAKLAAQSGTDTARQSLAEIAANPAESYDLRQQAAVALDGHSHPIFGSDELNLLAGVPEVLTGSAADKFYFYDARIRAAKQITDAKARVNLLSHTVIDFPRRNPARIPLFEAAVEAQSDNYALGILEPLLQVHALGNNIPDGDNRSDDAPEENEQPITNRPNSQPLAGDLQLSRVQQARVLQDAADAMTRLGRLSEALAAYQSAYHMDRSASARKSLSTKIATVKSTLSNQRDNASRQPLLHEALEQDRVVRPKLIAKNPPGSIGGARKEVAP